MRGLGLTSRTHEGKNTAMGRRTTHTHLEGRRTIRPPRTPPVAALQALKREGWVAMACPRRPRLHTLVWVPMRQPFR